ncbi:hypothetical protein WA026_008970 [Henosepilachna vigintioctopunctata]|uniref:Vitellogenin domain-containing protein n=1 Tax=Henosepilachna vigintioctopunctata TaxID=420089 RepID=A0AAW1VDL0_9CUCU
MWSQFLLCFLVGLTYASPAWKQNTEYTYEVRGRSLSSLNGAADDYSGIVIRAKLLVQTRPDRLRAKIIKSEYAEVHIKLPDGWTSKLPDSHLRYKALQLTNKPFDIVIKNGIVSELIVEDCVPEWEANIIKSFVSQFQLDTSAEHRVDSEFNLYPKPGSYHAVFKTLEDTVTGIAETSYDIHPLPEYVLQTEPYLAPFPHLKEMDL